ncbi:MAG: hypothetical protein AAGJ79_03555 [Verrucomicrobiota bacterium]
MRLIRLLLWLAVFAALTFLWMVLLEKGPEGFPDSVREEWEVLRERLSR